LLYAGEAMVIKLQLKKLFYQKEFYFSFFLMLMISIASFVLNCFRYFGEDMSNLISYNQLAIVSDSNSLSQILRYMIPLTAALPFAGSYFYEKKNNILPVVLTRTKNNKQYYYSTLFIVFLASFIVIFVPMLINLLLNAMTFPAECIRNTNWQTYEDYYYLKAHGEYILFSNTYVNHPLLYNLIFLSELSVFSGIIGVFTYNMSFYIKKNQYLVFALFFIISNVIEIISGALQSLNINIAYFDYLFAGREIVSKSVPAFIFMVLLLGCSIVFTIPGILKKLKDCI